MPDIAEASSEPRLRRLGRWDAGRGVLLLGGLLLVIAGYVLGARPSSYADLQAQVVAGEVDTVTVHGESLGPGSHGFTTLQVTWRDGLVPRVADVVEPSGPDVAPRAEGASRDSAVARGGVADELRSLDPDLVVVPQGDRRDGSTEVLGWSVPGSMIWGVIALWLGGFVLLARRREPWRATRWGWFWPMFLLPPLGVIAYAALSGPGFSPEPRERVRRLTGGWSFLLVVLVLLPLLD